MTKIFEKIMLKRMLHIGTQNNVDIMGASQHGFKANRSTITCGLALQSKIARLLDNDNYVIMASLDLSAAFDVVNHNLLLQRLMVMGFPRDIIELLRGWLNGRLGYVEIDGEVSEIFRIEHGVVQGSCLGPVLYNIFVSPMFSIFEGEAYADDSYALSNDRDIQKAKRNMEQTLARLVTWLTDSGMVVNKEKTEIIVFHRKESMKIVISIENKMITSKETIRVLGIIFDSKLLWENQVNSTITKSRRTLYAILMIKKYFTQAELQVLITSLFYSKLYYASEIWHTPFLKEILKDKLLSASSQALRKTFINTKPTSFIAIISNVKIHKECNRATPSNFMKYKHALMLYNIFNYQTPFGDWMDVNFNNTINERRKLFSCVKHNKYKVGLNLLSNRFTVINNEIPLEWLNNSKPSFKIKCKKLFLE